jgi:hypothetical protein
LCPRQLQKKVIGQELKLLIKGGMGNEHVIDVECHAACVFLLFGVW